MISSSLREIGKVKVPLVISIIATCLNTVCNWILIYGNLGAPRLEVRGAAIATVIARSVEALIFIGYMIKQKPDFAIKLFDVFRINFGLFGNILKKAWMIMLHLLRKRILITKLQTQRIMELPLCWLPLKKGKVLL